MGREIKVAMIGLDTSHTVEFVRRMQAPDCPEEQRVAGLRAVSCMRFATPFQDRKGLDERQRQLEEWGVEVTENFSEAVEDCEAVMIEINDPSCHLEYFEKCADLGKPIFLDKPLADNIENGRKIAGLARRRGLRVFSSSSLRFVPDLEQAVEKLGEIKCAHTYGPLGRAAAGSSIVWYGVHAFEMLEKAMGTGAERVYTREDDLGVVVVIDYPEARRGVVELTEGAYVYGGCVRTEDEAEAYVVDTSRIYTDQLREIARFFHGEEPPLSLDDALEVMALLDAAQRSADSGAVEVV